MTKGALNSTGITYGGNRTYCEDALIDINNGYNEASYLFGKNWYNFINVLYGMQEALLVGTSINGLTFNCYYGAEESRLLIGNYT